MHVGLMHFVKAKKILHAKRLIEAGARPTSIYLMCGYKDYATFFRSFKKITGKKPSEIRAERKNYL